MDSRHGMKAIADKSMVKDDNWKRREAVRSRKTVCHSCADRGNCINQDIFEGVLLSLLEVDISKILSAMDDLKSGGIIDITTYFDENPEYADSILCTCKIIDVNQSTVGLFEAENKENLLGSIHKIMPPEEISVFRGALIALARGERYFEVELVTHTLQCRRLHLLIGFSIPSEHISMRNILLVSVTDISDLKEAEGALRKSERMYRELVQNANSIILRRDYQGRITFMNDFAQTFFGYTEQEVLGRNVVGTFVPEVDSNGRNLTEMIREITLNPERYATNENENVCRNGERVWVSWTNRAIYDDNNDVVEILSIGNDITERKRLEDQFIQAQKMEAIGTLAGGIAHDFNNLLMAIQGRASLMMMDVESHHPFFEHLNQIQEVVRSGAGLTKQLLGFARKGKYEVKTVNINRIVENSIDMFGRTKKEIGIRKNYERDLWTVSVDRNQIEQVLLNIFVNAWQAMPHGGDITVNTGNVFLDESQTRPYQLEAGRYVSISVADTGLGMNEKTIERIFDPFFTTKELSRGTGLGLASAYGIIKNHDGFIRVESEEGLGSTFTIYLPASCSDILHESNSYRKMDVVKGNETILLIDDEKMILDVGEEILKVLGYQVILANSGREAIALFKKRKDTIDLIILDMIMPEMSGEEVLEHVKKIRPDVKVLLASGFMVDHTKKSLLTQSYDGSIQKPFEVESFSKTIRGILDT